MEAFALYLFKSVVWLTGFALVYLLFLRNERFFLLNRMYLVAGMVASILFPFFTWHYTIVIPYVPSVEVSDLQMTGIISEPEPFPTKEILIILYIAGAFYLLYRIIRQTATVVGVIRKSEILPYRSAKLIRTDAYPCSFSFFSFVFVNPSSSDTETSEIVNHEMEHVRQRHWIDLLLFELLCTLQWLNPLCWLYGRFIRQNHEFLADRHALQRTQNPAIYRAALINQLFGAEVISLANSFNYSINKKRFHMMKNTIHPPYRKLKLLVILPLIAAVFYAFATPEYRYANGNLDQKTSYSITQDKVEIPFTNQLTKADLEAIKAELAKVGMAIDYSSLEFTKEGNLKGMSAKVTSETGSVSWNSKDISPSNYPVFKKEPTGEFGIYFSTIIKGTVYNEKGVPLPRVAVTVIGSNASIGTITNEAGEFELKGVTQNENIVFSYVGYQSAIVKAEAGRQMIINLKPVNIGIDEVTITGQGAKVDQMSIGSSFKLQTNSPLKFGNANGSASQPLIVIDGVITDNANVNNIPPETIESISVLKGESATKLYGEKGKNGVILITKKKGTSTSQNSLIDVNINQNANTQKDKDVYTIVEQMPEFPGGESALRKYLAYNIKYPKSAVDNGIQGKVFVGFVVDKTGKVTDAKIVRGVDPSLDQEGLRVVMLMPLWKPGKQGGEDVSVEYTIPINFVLEPAQTATKEEKGSEPYTVVEQMPEFPGGAEALKTYIATNVKYPDIALAGGVQGQVIVSFLVDKTGNIYKANIKRGVETSLDKEALRVINSMPKWNPGKQNGENVTVTLDLPINFKLPDDYNSENYRRKEKLRPMSGTDNPPYTIVEQMPEYPGGVEAMKNYIASNIKYPVIALENGIQGKVYVGFVVTKTGKVTNAKVLRGVDPIIDQEAVRVVESMPAWIPGKQNGENVIVDYTIPIEFAIPKDYKRTSGEKLRTSDNGSQAGKLVIVPNPTRSRATVTLEGSDSTNQLQVSIIDSYGKMVKQETKKGPSFTLSVSSLTPGTYRIVAVDGNRQYQGSLVVNH